MSLLAIVDISHPDMALVPTIRQIRDVQVTVVPHSATDAETGLFFFLVESDGPFDTFEEALADDHTVAEWTLVTESDASRIYQLRHTDRTKLLSPKTAEVGGLMAEAESSHRGWTVGLQLPDRQALSDLWEYCKSEDITFELVQLYRQDRWTVGETTGLTEAQRVALTTAYEEGYFEEPRETSLEALAEKLELSPSAVGGRIRRGMVSLVESTIIDEE